MATNFLTFHSPVIRASATSTSGKRCVATNSNLSPSSNNSSWWSPIFGWSSNPDYIDGKNEDTSTSGSDRDVSRLKYSPGCFTEEKAKQLRIMTTKTETFHDVMYHSAIASRLASDFSRRSDR